MARRVNRKFVTILLVSIVGAGVAVYIAQNMLIRQHPDQLIEAGTTAMADRNWTDAVADFSQASSLSPRDPEIQMKLALALHNLASTDGQSAAQERAAYDRALEIDPNYLPALKAVIAWCQQYLAYSPSAELYRSLVDYAHRASELVPDDLTYPAIAAKAVVEKSLAGLSTDQQEVTDAITQLRALMVKLPADADLPYTISQAKIQQGQELTRQSTGTAQPKEATALYTEAVGMFENIFSGPDGGPQDHNAEMHYSYAQILERLAVVDQSDPGEKAKYQERAQDEIDRARALVKDKDPKFLEINGYAVDMANRRGNRALAIQILRSLPDMATVRLSLARMLGESPDTRPEAERTLESTIQSMPGDPDHMDAFRFQLVNLLTSLRISDYTEAKDPAEKQRLLTQINDSIAAMQASRGQTMDRIEITRQQARMDLIAGKNIEVIQSLSRLMSDDPRAGKDANILLMLSSAYDAAHQSGKAISYLSELIDQYPTQTQARKMLAQLLLRDFPAQAPAQIDELEKQLPNDPQVIELRIAQLDAEPDKNKAAIKGYFDRLPEGSMIEMLNKAQRALALRYWDESIRLLTGIVAKDPKNVSCVVSLSKVYLIDKQKDKALEVATQGLKDNPDSPDLKLLIPQLNGDDPSKIETLRKELVLQTPDPLQRWLGLSQLAGERGDVGEVEKDLKEAEKIAPENPHVWDELFQLYLRTNRLDEAAPYVDKLAGANYDSAGGALYRFRLARSRNDNGTALKIARQLTQDKPEFATTWVSLGEVLQAQGQFDQAIAQYAVALEKQSDNYAAIKGLVECYYGLGKTNEALSYINQGLAKYPDDTNFRNMLLNHQLNYGNPSDAISAMQDELNRSPGNPKLIADLAGTYLRVAKMQDAQKSDDADAMREKAQKMLKDALVKWPDEGSLYLGLAECALQTNRLADAETILKQWAARDAWKGQSEPYLKLSQFYEQVRQPRLAEDAMRTAVARSSYRVDLQIQLAQLLASHGKYDEALQLLRATNTDNASVQRQVIGVLVAANRMDEAQAELKAAIDKKPANADDLLTLWAQVLLDHKQFAAAQDKAEQALAINSNDQPALYFRALARMNKTPPDLQGAIDDLTTLRQNSPYSPEVRLSLADALIQAGREDDAATELEASLKTNRMNKSARMRLVQIYMSAAHPRYKEALQLLTDVETTPPFDKDPDIFQNEAVVLSAKGDVPAAIEKSQRARQLAPDSLPLLQTYLSLLLRANQYQDVLDQTAPMLDKDKSSWWFMMDRGIARKNLKDVDGAMADMKQAVLDALAQKDTGVTLEASEMMAANSSLDASIDFLKSQSEQTFSNKIALSLLEHRKGDDVQAVSTVESISDVDHLSPNDQANFYSAAASIYAGARPNPMVDKAYAAYSKLLTMNPDDYHQLNDLACLLIDKAAPPRIPEAMQYAQKASDLMTRAGRSEPAIMDTLGWCQILSGTPDVGVIQMQKVIDLQPFPEAYYHLGEGYLRLNYPDEAVRQANLGLDMLNKQNSDVPVDSKLKANLQDLLARSQDKVKSNQQAQTQ